MSSLRRPTNQSTREGTSARRHALTGATSKSVRNILHTTTAPGSPLRHRSKYELRSISLEGTKVLPWTSRPRNTYQGPLNSEELSRAEKVILRITQQDAFAQERHDLTRKQKVHHRSILAPLNPFIDTEGLIRVGGRLQNAQINYDQQHPILLPRSHHITELIIRAEHQRNLHAGIQNTLYAVRQRYWPLDGRNQVRKIIRQCVKCQRSSPPSTEYAMGNLPEARVTEARPFTHVGVDYCGPFQIKQKKFRNRVSIKIYVAVFVCFSTKAVHLEVVSDMTTEGFLAALRRFVARRGKCKTIHSDNGTNFVGARNELAELQTLMTSETHQLKVNNYLTNEGIKWRFIPPRAPHVGGLWEAAVKSFKHHLRRVVGTELFTFEEFNTLVIEIESILNSRPLTPLSSDPNDMLALSPGHFLIGGPLNGVPEPDFSITSTNRLSRWQHIQKVKRDFWTRWHKEYLNELNIRHKWTTGHHNLKKGDLVILKEDNTPPLQWNLGRIIDVYPGTDGIVRTVNVKTANSIVSRNVRKLAPLLIDSDPTN